jgi:hypothetical protein
MAFGDVYGFKTNSRVVVAVAETDEYSDGEDTVVDVVLLGVDNGRRRGVLVAADAESAAVNEVFPASEA